MGVSAANSGERMLAGVGYVVGVAKSGEADMVGGNRFF